MNEVQEKIMMRDERLLTTFVIEKIHPSLYSLLCAADPPPQEVVPHQAKESPKRPTIDNSSSNHTVVGYNVSPLIPYDPDFQAAFSPHEMRCLALVSHNGMKATMKQFVVANKNVLKKFRLTGTNSTMTMLKEVFGEDPQISFGPVFKSGPLGGDAELIALMCSGGLGGLIFFQDPMSNHPHQSDIEALCRQGLVYNVMLAQNPTSALMIMHTLRLSLQENRPEFMPSFFLDLQSPTVLAYQRAQKKVVESHKHEEDLIKIEDSAEDEPDTAMTTSSNTSTTNDVKDEETKKKAGEDELAVERRGIVPVPVSMDLPSSMDTTSNHQPRGLDRMKTVSGREQHTQHQQSPAGVHCDDYTQDDYTVPPRFLLGDDSSVLSNQSSIDSFRDSKMNAEYKLFNAINNLVKMSSSSARKQDGMRNETLTGSTAYATGMQTTTTIPNEINRLKSRDLLDYPAHDISHGLQVQPVLDERLSRSEHNLDLRSMLRDRSTLNPTRRSQDYYQTTSTRSERDFRQISQALERDNHHSSTSRISHRTRRNSYHGQGSELFDVHEDDDTVPEFVVDRRLSNSDHGYFSARRSSFHDGLDSDDWLLLDRQEEGDYFETAAPSALDDRLSRSEHGQRSISVASRRNNNDRSFTRILPQTRRKAVSFKRQGGELSLDFLEKEDALLEVLEDRLTRRDHGYTPLYRDQEQMKMNASRRYSRRDNATRSSTGIGVTKDSTSSKGAVLEKNNNGGDAATGVKVVKNIAKAGKVAQQEKGGKKSSARRPRIYSAYHNKARGMMY